MIALECLGRLEADPKDGSCESSSGPWPSAPSPAVLRCPQGGMAAYGGIFPEISSINPAMSSHAKLGCRPKTRDPPLLHQTSAKTKNMSSSPEARSMSMACSFPLQLVGSSKVVLVYMVWLLLLPHFLNPFLRPPKGSV